MEKYSFTTTKRISDELEEMLNIQIKRELDSSMIYLSMSDYLKYVGFPHAGELYKKYSDEELTHMHKIRDYLQDRNALPNTPGSETQEREYDSICEIFQKTYDHEVQVSKWLSEIATKALSVNDLTTYQFLNWFINEQIEEENKALYWIDRIETYYKHDKPVADIDEEIADYMG